MSAPDLPASLVDNPRLDRWIRFQPDRTVRIATGKVEIGQGVVTAIGQIAADELDVPLDRVAVLSGDTDRWAGRALHDVVAVDRGVRRLGAAGLRRGARQGAGAGGAAAQLQPRRARRWSTASSCRTARRPARTTGRSRPRSISRQAVTGTAPAEAAPRPTRSSASSVPRVDLPAKVSGAAFVHDLRAARPAACPHAAPAQPRRHAGGARRGGDPPRREGRAADRARGQLRRLRQPGRERGAGRRRRRARCMRRGTTCGSIDAGAAGGGLAEGPAQPRTGASARRAADGAAQAPGADHRLAALHRACLDGAVLRAGRVPRRPSHGVVARPGHASAAQEPGGGARPADRGRSPRATCTAPAATATTAPTMPRSTRR